MSKFVQLLDNYPYQPYIPPSASALAEEVGNRLLSIIEKLDSTNSQTLADQLIYIANVTNYPLQRRSHKIYNFPWLSEDDYELTDWLISRTVEKGNSTFCGCIVATLRWMLTKNETPLSNHLKKLGLNTAYAKFIVSDYLKYLN